MVGRCSRSGVSAALTTPAICATSSHASGANGSTASSSAVTCMGALTALRLRVCCAPALRALMISAPRTTARGRALLEWCLAALWVQAHCAGAGSCSRP